MRIARRNCAALALVGMACAVNEWIIGHVLTDDGTIDDALVRTSLAVFDGVLVLAALWLFFRRSPINGKAILFRFVAIGLALIFLEGLLHVVRFVEKRAEKKAAPKYLLTPYEGKDWARRLFAESDDVQQREGRFSYHPFLGWDSNEFHGEFVNIDANGVRRTWNPDFPPGRRVPSIYVFGGSTVWGVGVRDEYTIPSHLSRALYERGHELMVHNYGDIAYCFTQELINLVLALKEGHRPDYVIFYDGVNDIYAAYREGMSGRVLDMFGTRERFNERMRAMDHFLRGTRMFMNEHCMTYHYVSRLAAGGGANESPFREAGARFSDERLGQLAEDIAEFYASSQRLLEPLSHAYGFEYETFWQPVAFTESRLLEEEKTDIRTSDASLGKLHRDVLARLNQMDLPRFHDISDALAGRTKTTYIDYCHLTEEGNGVIAAKICDLLERDLPRLTDDIAPEPLSGAVRRP